MSARRLLLGLACALAALCAGVGWVLFAHDARRAQAVAPAAAATALLAPRGAALDARDVLADDAQPASAAQLSLAGEVHARTFGIPPPVPDTLACVRGRVLDARTQEPVSGITLSFLSRRPKTCSVVSDSEGRFQTGVELATGVISVMHAPDASNPRFMARWDIDPGEFLLEARAAADDARAIVLLAQSPERVLEVDIRLPEGSSAAGAAVTLTHGRRDAAGQFLAEGRDYEVSDAAGRARFALFGADIFELSFLLEAEHEGVWASDVLTLDPPLATRPLKLDLHPGGTIRVRARNDEGKPVAGVSLWLSSSENGRFTRGHNGDTDARGEYSFGAVRAGCYTISAVHPLTGQTLQQEVDLPRGAQVAVDFQLTLHHLRLGLSGTVVDEFGYPLPGIAVRVQAAGEAACELETGEGGRFEFWCKPAQSLLFSAGGGFLDDPFEPAFCSVPFGTTNLDVRRTSTRTTHVLPFVVLDERTHSPAPHARITLYHARDARSRQTFNADAGVAQVTFKLRDDTFYVVDAPGYLRAQASLAALCDESGPGAALRVELAPGFERQIEVRDRVSKRVLANASFFDGPRSCGSSDEQGGLLLQAPEWPVAYRVECAGYQTALWDPAAAEFPGTTVWLEPQRPRQ